MATLTFRRPRWFLEISKTSKRFSISFSTALPKRYSQRQSSSSHGRLDHTIPRPLIHQQVRTAFTSTRIYQQEETNAATSAPKTTPPPNINSDLTSGFNDAPLILDEGSRQVDWSKSFHGLSTAAFPKEAADALLAPINEVDVEVKPDGILYLPEIKYRRILNKAFGPGAWGLAPRGETIVTAKAVTREYALLALGRLVSVARGEQDYFSADGIPTATEGCKSNALMRCCKDLGVASELWDPRFIREFQAKHVKELWVEHAVTKKKRKIYLRKGDKVEYPFKESKM